MLFGTKCKVTSWHTSQYSTPPIKFRVVSVHVKVEYLWKEHTSEGVTQSFSPPETLSFEHFLNPGGAIVGKDERRAEDKNWKRPGG